MNEVNLFIRIFLACILLSSAISKVQNIQEHVAIVKDYLILPNIIVPLFTKVNIVVELSVGVCLLVGLFEGFVEYAVILILLTYSIAITINLIRGRTKVSCGCGGISGTHYLSRWLVIRNLIFILAGAWLLQTTSSWFSIQAILLGKSLHHVFNLEAVVTILFSVLFLISVTLISKILTMQKMIRTIFQKYKIKG